MPTVNIQLRQVRVPNRLLQRLHWNLYRKCHPNLSDLLSDQYASSCTSCDISAILVSQLDIALAVLTVSDELYWSVFNLPSFMCHMQFMELTIHRLSYVFAIGQTFDNGQCMCSSGYYMDSSNSCVACAPGCITCSGPVKCDTMKINRYQNRNTGVLTCLDESTYSDGTNCVSCHETCKSCKGGLDTDCIACKLPSMDSVNGLCQCQPRFFFRAGVCEACDLSCDSATASLWEYPELATVRPASPTLYLQPQQMVSFVLVDQTFHVQLKVFAFQSTVIGLVDIHATQLVLC